MSLLWIEVSFLSASIAISGAGLLNKEQWAHNSWLIPVLFALLWGVIQDGY